MHIRRNLGDDIADGETGFTPAAVFQPAQTGTGFKLRRSSFTPAPPPPPATHTSSKPAASHEEEFPSGQDSM